jgi:hypothetical protein
MRREAARVRGRRKWQRGGNCILFPALLLAMGSSAHAEGSASRYRVPQQLRDPARVADSVVRAAAREAATKNVADLKKFLSNTSVVRIFC